MAILFFLLFAKRPELLKSISSTHVKEIKARHGAPGSFQGFSGLHPDGTIFIASIIAFRFTTWIVRDFRFDRMKFDALEFPA